MKSFALEIRTPEAIKFSGNVFQIIAQASDGKIGILPGHAPLATKLSHGNIKCYLENGEEKSFDVEGGFLIVKKNKASVLSC